MKISTPEPLKLLAEIGNGTFTIMGAGVYYSFLEFKYRVIGITPDGKGIALEIVSETGEN